MRRKESRRGEQLMGFVNGRVVVFIMRRVSQKIPARGKTKTGMLTED